MLRIDRTGRRFTRLDTPSLAGVSLTERYDLQEFIINSPEDFFGELGLELFLLGQEVVPSAAVLDRIDLLALDKAGACVVIELKRGSHKLQMLQAISYAGMISSWSAAELLELIDERGRERLEEFLDVTPDEINRSQRIVLIAEAFDYALLASAEWLTERYGLSVTCCRVAVAREPQTGSEYLVCSNVYPAPELADQAIPRGRRAVRSGATEYCDWDTALSGIDNPAIVAYFREQVAVDRESNLRKRSLFFRLDGARRWFVQAARAHAYVWQYGRFDDDLEYWRSRLSAPDSIRRLANGKSLRYRLETKADCEAFHAAATHDLQAVKWIADPLDDTDDEAVNEGVA